MVIFKKIETWASQLGEKLETNVLEKNENYPTLVTKVKIGE
jgi:hypothetical protein